MGTLIWILENGLLRMDWMGDVRLGGKDRDDRGDTIGSDLQLKREELCTE